MCFNPSTWALDQLFDITALFAKQGDKEAKQAIYKRYYKREIIYCHLEINTLLSMLIILFPVF